MSSFPLKIVTPDGLIFDGEAERLIVRSTTGDLAIMAHHINYVTPLGMGKATVIANGKRREAACIGGMLSVVDGSVTLVPTTFEWAEKIDVARVETSLNRAEEVLNNSGSTDSDLKLAAVRLHRALVRKSVAGQK